MDVEVPQIRTNAVIAIPKVVVFAAILVSRSEFSLCWTCYIVYNAKIVLSRLSAVCRLWRTNHSGETRLGDGQVMIRVRVNTVRVGIVRVSRVTVRHLAGSDICQLSSK